ncbi:MAG: hypothetical protein M3Q95_02060 [Bacteroidota bacterium]|nr:hypothetical protein [Bacteroidota bacterium]
MIYSISRFLSYVLHPLLMPFYAVLLLLSLNTYIAYSISPQLQRIILSLVFVITTVLPVLTALILLQKGMIRSLEMHSVAERRLPFISTAFFYLICYYLLLQLPIPRMLSLMVLAATLSIFIAWLLSFKWKVSIHMIGMGGITGMLFGLSQVLNAGLIMMILSVILISGLLGSARLFLGSHTQAQIYAGYVIGLAMQWWIMTWFSA